jgi:hypothetical protein
VQKAPAGKPRGWDVACPHSTGATVSANSFLGGEGGDAGSSWADDGRRDASEAAKCARICAAPAASGDFGHGWCASKADVAADVAGGVPGRCDVEGLLFRASHAAGLVLAWRLTTLLWSP